MRSIKPLPEAVHSSVRSGIILFDLTRVVEELIYNSLDAGATKVSVSISVGTCYIKVVDDGTGVTRDGLVLLGERYATSKLHHLTEMDAATGSFGFRGEALGSISDVSLLEIVTKTQGRPNGYRKVMKGCKCLYLGIDDDRQDVGTTVVVRDLFYNQPVRRKYLQSSPKKVLHSVKKCVFRIALVHSNVSFKVVDIESDDELLCTKSSSSPLSLLISGLGIEDSSSLHELNITDGILKLSGYVSGPCNTFSIKAFQYVYINSRFICKGPIHKLLNQLATGFKSFDPWKASSGSQDKKRSRCQGYPTYILNLRCPQSHYDLTFEPSRTAVEFKDWVPILAFLEKAVTRFWSEHIAHGESSMHANKTSGKELWKEHGNVVSAEEGTAWQEEASSDWPSPRLVTKPEMCTGLDFMSRDSLKSLSTYRERFAVENNVPPDSVEQCGKLGPGHLSLNSECCSMVSQSLFQTTPWDVEHFTHENTPQGGLGSGRNVSYEHFIDSESGEWIFSHNIMPSSSSQENCSSSSCMNTGLGLKDYTVPSRDIYRLLKENDLDNIFTPRHSDILSIETDWLYSNSCSKDNNNNRTVPSCSIPLSTYIHKDENKKERLRYQNCGQIHASKERSRSHSAPPIYRGKRKFLALNDHWTMESKKVDVIDIHDAPTFPETDELKHPLQSSGACNQYFKPSLLEDPLFYGRSDMKKMLENEPDMDKIQNIDIFRKSQCLHIDDDSYSFKDFTTKEATDLMNSESKWRNNCPKIASGDKSQKFNDQYNVLDISSGILHLAGDSLIPQSITKNCLQDAKVLQQVDKKFIPVVADGTLAIIDQHAADERIRLEELRQKVLSGEVKTITYLDAEQELVLPEIGYQLLHTYAEQIQNWGWICNIHAQNSRSFTKNLDLLHKKPTVITLLAVPCILGVNLSDVDLLEFLQQLADTDGSSTMPPSVLRVLNLKACRGAIMFGDTLLPSECSLIVEELKRTSLCFQCAHGRPTTVPLVNLEALHKQISKLGLGGGGSIELWHGLRRHELSLERAAQRLNSSMG